MGDAFGSKYRPGRALSEQIKEKIQGYTSDNHHEKQIESANRSLEYQMKKAKEDQEDFTP
jgi:hypothetical protein